MYDVFNGGGKGCGECGGDYGGDSDGVFVGGVMLVVVAKKRTSKTNSYSTTSTIPTKTTTKHKIK